MSSDRGIPMVDLQHYVNGQLDEKEGFVQNIGTAFQNIGFVAVKGHHISEALIQRFYHAIEQFFALDIDTKKKYEIIELAGQRGYTSFGRESAKGSNQPDLKEFYQFGQRVMDGDPVKHEYPDNIYVDELAEFNEAADEIFEAFEKDGKHILSSLAEYIGVPVNYFEEFVHNGNSILRSIHYPPITHEPASAVRAEQHEDINLITLLVGASAEGLQVLSTKNKWVDIKLQPGELAVNVGDMLQRLTNNRLKSTTHRVVNPPREKWQTHRYSIPFFLHPKGDMRLNCLEHCISADYPLQYDPITAGEYLDERLIELGLKK